MSEDFSVDSNKGNRSELFKPFRPRVLPHKAGAVHRDKGSPSRAMERRSPTRREGWLVGTGIRQNEPNSQNEQRPSGVSGRKPLSGIDRIFRKRRAKRDRDRPQQQSRTHGVEYSVRQHMTTATQPSREAFIAYWKDYRYSPWRELLWWIGYPGGLALYAWVVSRLDLGVGVLTGALVVAVAYIVLVPYLTCLTIRRAYARVAHFIRCPHCGDRFDWNIGGANPGPSPKFREVIETGRCVRCGAQVLSDA